MFIFIDGEIKKAQAQSAVGTTRCVMLNKRREEVVIVGDNFFLKTKVIFSFLNYFYCLRIFFGLMARSHTPHKHTPFC